MSGKNSIQVAIKVRPLFRNEKNQFSWRVVNNSLQLIDSQSEPYYFDHIFDQDVTNQIIFDKMAKPIVHSAVEGFNGTIFAYGQTSSGKTYTMMGDDDNPGVMVLAAKEIFKEIERTQDRQFLLRVGYIEIYNEKIYDLLNKKNQDLKIHETNTGIVSVNCEEMIIRSEDDLLSHLERGGKERTVGETNMNERSSRSHAIFRIIIESRKMDRSEDDTIIQSVINLVDLAGSERAGQTGATGARLKEGGHINKSLLFLSNVIKRLSENEEDKYISFRDSKLTRILQASLGGNALTAIICTIKPNTVEETQSTLSFAMRAKTIKNKPQVSEIVSDATMMKRLEKEIKVLKTRLEEEQRKNESQIKVRQLEERIKDEDLKIISCNSLHSNRSREKRRRTWCPSSTNLDTTIGAQLPSSLPVPNNKHRLQAPKIYNTPLIGIRTPTEPPPSTKLCSDLPITPDNLPEIDEEFAPAELENCDMLSPQESPLKQQLQRISITPKLLSCRQATLEKVEHDLLELQSFTNLENKIEVKHEAYTALKQKVETLSQRNTVLENERLEYLHFKNEIEITAENLTVFQKRCNELQIQISKLTNSNNTANETIAKYEAELADLKKTNEKLEMENREGVNLEFEFKRHKNKSQLRETELLEVLDDKEKEITKLQKSVNSLSEERLQNSKEALFQKSFFIARGNTTDRDDNICIKCEDLQRLLEENKKNSLEFDKLTLEYEKLKLNYAEIEKENERNKLKVVYLEELQQKDKAEHEKLLLDVQQLREKLQKVQNDYKGLTIENSSKHEECIALNRQVEVAREEMVVLEGKFTKLELSWQEQQQTINNIEAQYATIQRKYEQLQGQYQQLEVTRGQSLTDYQRLEKENSDLLAEIEDLKEKVHDAQNKLLESNAKCEETATETKTAKEEYSAKCSRLQQENEQLKQELLEIQTQFENLQKEYDDLSNQLMDNLQDNDHLKKEYTKLQETLNDNEKNIPIINEEEAEINELKSQLQELLSSDEFNMEIENIPLQGSFNKHSFHSVSVALSGEDKSCNCCENAPEYVEKLKQEIMQLKTSNEHERLRNKSLMESAEQGFREMREQISQLTVELLEKSTFVENCACNTYKQQIENLEKENADITLVCEELKEKFNCTSNTSASDFNDAFSNTAPAAEVKAVADDNIKELERLKLRELELLETYDSQTKTLEKMSQRCIDMEANLEIVRAQLKNQEKEFKEKNCQLQLENLQKLELSASEYRENMKKYNKEWENRKDDYEQTITNLHTQINILKPAAIKAEWQETEIDVKNFDDRQETLVVAEHQEEEETFLPEDVKAIKEDKCRLEEENLSLQQHLNTAEDALEHLKEENLIQYEELVLLEAKLVFLEELYEDSKVVHVTINRENASLKTEIDDIKDDLNCIPELHDKNQQLSDEMEKLNWKYSHLKDKLQKAEIQIQEFRKEDQRHKELIPTLETKLTHVTELEEENKNLANNLENLKLEYAQVNDKLHKAEAQVQEFCNEDASREEFIQTLQNKLCHMRSVEEENKNLENQLEERVNHMSQAIKEKLQMQQDLQSLRESIIKTVAENQKQLEETQREKDKAKQDNAKLYQDLLELKESFNKVTEEHRKQEQKMEECKQDNSQFKQDLTKLEQEKQDQQLTLEKIKQEHINLQQVHETLKESLSNVVERKQQELNHLENSLQTTQQKNQELEQELKKLTTEFVDFKATEQQVCNESLAKMQEELQNVQGKLVHYEKLQDDKNKLETTLNILKRAQGGALSSLQEEKDQLHKTIKQYEQQQEEFKENEKTLKEKIESLYQQLHEMRGKVQSYEILLMEQNEMESALKTTTAANQKLQQEILQLTSQQEKCESKIENLSCQIEKLNCELDKHTGEKQILQTKLSHLEETLQGKQSSMRKENHELNTFLKELQLKYNSLQETNTQLETLNQKMEQQLNSAKDKLDEHNIVQEELKTLKVQHNELQNSFKKTVHEAEHCSLVLHEDIKGHKQLFQKQLEKYTSLKTQMETKQRSLSEENHKLSANVQALQKEKLSLEQKLREIIVRNFEQDLQHQAIDAPANTSTDSNSTCSPRGRKSLERINDKVANITLEGKLIQQKNSTTAERKNRRLSTHDERRRQSYWGAVHDKETMTNPTDTSCNCMALDLKLKDCERNLFIKTSQVTALNMELKNHPLKEENAGLKKRLQEEQDKHRNEIKRYKNKLYEQNVKTEKAMTAAAHATANFEHAVANVALGKEQQEAQVLPKVVIDVEVQTESDLNASLHKLQSKYNDLKNICRYRYNVIKELEEKVAQKENSDVNSLSALESGPYKMLHNNCELLKKELNTTKEKYEFAKKTLSLRREEITNLRAQLEDRK